MLLLTLAALAASESSGFAIDWRVPCAAAPDATELVGSAKGSAEVEITPEGTGWRLLMRFIKPSSGERIMHTATCEEAAGAALVLLRLSARGQRAPPLLAQPLHATPLQTAPLHGAPIELTPLEVTPLETTAPEAAPPRVKPLEAPPLPRAPEQVDPPPRLRGSVALGVLAQHGPLPTVATRVGLTIGLEWPSSLALFLSLRGGPPTVLLDEGARVSAQPILGAQLSACSLHRVGRFSGGPCGVLGAETWEVSSRNVVGPRTSIAVPVGLGLDARGALRLWSGLSLTASIGVRIALLRPSVYFQDTGILFQSHPFAAEGELGIRWTW